MATEPDQTKKDEVKQEPVKAPVKVEATKPTTNNKKVVKGDLVRSKMGHTADAITCQAYPSDSWTEVEKPSDWLDAQLAAGKFERK